VILTTEHWKCIKRDRKKFETETKSKHKSKTASHRDERVHSLTLALPCRSTTLPTLITCQPGCPSNTCSINEAHECCSMVWTIKYGHSCFFSITKHTLPTESFLSLILQSFSKATFLGESSLIFQIRFKAPCTPPVEGLCLPVFPTWL
jgi:hypothetical protein